MTELAIPEPRGLVGIPYADNARQALAEMDDLDGVAEAQRRLLALERYVKGKRDRHEVQAAARWAEVRIGQLLEPAVVGSHLSALKGSELTPEERVWFRRLAFHVQLVEDCIGHRNDEGEIVSLDADGNEVAPKTSRAAVLNEITKRTVGTPPLPEDVFRAIVIDPPWPMPEIEREQRPGQQGEVSYPTMSIDALSELPIKALADPAGAHLYLWVTHKFLPDGLDLMAAWGFKYQCVMTWRKNVGITPFSWMYDTEHVLFGRLGNLQLARLGLRLSFDAPAIGHSTKPDVFYERVLEASPGPRLEMFARTVRRGFTAWGNEVADGIR